MVTGTSTSNTAASHDDGGGVGWFRVNVVDSGHGAEVGGCVLFGGGAYVGCNRVGALKDHEYPI